MNSKYKADLLLKFVAASLICLDIVSGNIRNKAILTIICILGVVLAWDVVNMVIVASFPQVRYSKNKPMQRLIKHYIKKYNLE